MALPADSGMAASLQFPSVQEAGANRRFVKIFVASGQEVTAAILAILFILSETGGGQHSGQGEGRAGEAVEGRGAAAGRVLHTGHTSYYSGSVVT